MSEANSSPDWVSLGILLTIVGSFLLGNAILFRSPRHLVEELLGVRRRRLAHLREHIFHRVQVGVGFLYLMGGFALQLYAHHQPWRGEEREFPSFWAGALLVGTLVLLGLGWWYAAHAFRVALREVLEAEGLDLVSRSDLTRELGALLGVEPTSGETTDAYAARVRAELGLPVSSGVREVRPRPEPSLEEYE